MARDARHAGGRRPTACGSPRRSSTRSTTASSPRASWSSRRSSEWSRTPRPRRSAPASCASACPRAEHVSAPSTADAVLSVCGSDEPVARSARALAAQLYGCQVVASNVEDHPDNVTRFVWLARAGEAEEPVAEAKTSIVFWGGGDQSPGWLVDVLTEFSDRGVNLTRIESRPRRTGLGPLLLLRGPRGRGGLPRRSARRSRRSPSTSRSCAYSGLTGDRPGYTERTVAVRANVSFTTEPGDVEPGPLLALPGAGRPEQRATSSGRVLVLNASYEPINVCTVRRAAVLILKNRAEILEKGDWALHSESAHARPPGRDPAAHLRAHPARRAPPQDHPARGVRARPLDLPVLRPRARQPHRRPRDPALEGRALHVGEHRHLLRALQPAQGRPAAEAGEHGPGASAEGAQPGDLHPRRGARRSPPRGSSTSWWRPDGRASAGRRRPPYVEDERPATYGELRSTRRWLAVAAVWAVAATALAVFALIEANEDDSGERTAGRRGARPRAARAERRASTTSSRASTSCRPPTISRSSTTGSSTSSRPPTGRPRTSSAWAAGWTTWRRGSTSSSRRHAAEQPDTDDHSVDATDSRVCFNRGTRERRWSELD